jgi:type I restriction enzyme S subunit
MGNIQNGQLVADALKYLPTEHQEFPKLLLEPDDLLFNRTNSYELVGKTAIYSGTPEPCSFASYLIRVRFLSSVLSKFVAYFINSAYGREWISSVVSQQVGQANVNGTKLRALSVPLPPPEEQRFVVEEVERRLSVVDKLEATVEANLKQAGGLRQSILKGAFSGELVPQDPEDEPASELLARIREERDAAKQKSNRRRSRKAEPAKASRAEQEQLFGCV